MITSVIVTKCMPETLQTATCSASLPRGQTAGRKPLAADSRPLARPLFLGRWSGAVAVCLCGSGACLGRGQRRYHRDRSDAFPTCQYCPQPSDRAIDPSQRPLAHGPAQGADMMVRSVLKTNTVRGEYREPSYPMNRVQETAALYRLSCLQRRTTTRASANGASVRRGAPLLCTLPHIERELMAHSVCAVVTPQLCPATSRPCAHRQTLVDMAAYEAQFRV